MATVEHIEQNVQHIFSVTDEDGGVSRDAIFYPLSEYVAKTKEQLDADCLARFEARRASAVVPVSETDIAEAEKAQRRYVEEEIIALQGQRVELEQKVAALKE